MATGRTTGFTTDLQWLVSIYIWTKDTVDSEKGKFFVPGGKSYEVPILVYSEELSKMINRPRQLAEVCGIICGPMKSLYLQQYYCYVY